MKKNGTTIDRFRSWMQQTFIIITASATMIGVPIQSMKTHHQPISRAESVKRVGEVDAKTGSRAENFVGDLELWLKASGAKGEFDPA